MGDFCKLYNEKSAALQTSPRSDILTWASTNSTTLELRGNSTENFTHRLSDLQFQAFAFAIVESGRTLTALDLSYNHLWEVSNFENNDDSTSVALSSLLSSENLYHCNLQVLNLLGNNMDSQAATEITPALVSNTTLRTLNLNGNPIGNSGGLAIAEAIGGLKLLDLGNTSLEHDAIIAIANAVSEPSSVMEELNLENPLRDHNDEETFQHLSKMLQLSKTLLVLNVSKHGMTDASALVFTERLTAAGSTSALISLNISSNKIGCTGAKALAALLCSCKRITKLNLSLNAIHDEGAMAFRAVLEDPGANIEVLNLKSCKIKSEGLIEIIKGLSSNTSLVELSLWGNGGTPFSQEVATELHELHESRLKYTQLKMDIQTYIVDGKAQVAQI